MIKIGPSCSAPRMTSDRMQSGLRLDTLLLAMLTLFMRYSFGTSWYAMFWVHVYGNKIWDSTLQQYQLRSSLFVPLKKNISVLV